VPILSTDRKAPVDPQIEIFRAGRHTPMEGGALSFSEADLAAMASAYDPAVHEAPIVVGHPRADAPAYGWVGGLALAGDRLQASARQVDPAFAELVAAGRFKKVSASFYAPDSPANPKPGAYYLRHVGFLGAQPPAVKGLKAASFAEDEPGVIHFADAWSLGVVARLMRGLREWVIGREGLEAADRVLPAYEIEMLSTSAAVESAQPAPAFTEPNTPETPPVITPNPGASPSPREIELEAEVARLRAQTTSFVEAEATRRRADDAGFLERLQAEGRLLPANAALAAGLLGALDGGESVSFAEGRAAETPREALRALLAAQPVAVNFAEVAGGEPGPVDHSAPAIAARALALQDSEKAAGRDISFAEAVSRVGTTNA
jgi:hypothetical protein